VSLGCPKALVDSERIITQLRAEGYELTKRHAGADLVIVNTCGFLDSAKAESLGAIGEALGGIRYVTGYPDRPPPRVGVSLGDALAATMGCIGTLLALYARDGRQGSGRGQVVDVAIYEAVWAYMESILPEWTKLGTIRERTGSILPGVAPSNVYPSREGEWVLIAANADAVFRRLAEAVGQPEWAADPRFATHHARGEHQTLLDDLLAQWTSQRGTAEILAAMDEAGVPAGRIYTARDIARDPHYAARDMIVEQHQPSLGEAVPMQGIVPKLSETPGTLHSPAPGLGEHNAAVYGGLLGLSATELEKLRTDGVI
jgi:crotonobetainyl-CoA:carnitine CoA-transferase CaiB-like acyl-CoA transferase